MTQLDEKDLKIIQALDEHGPKVSTQTLSNILDIPSRTIRYRILKLKEKGFIKNIRAITHERKLGLGEKLVLFDINQKMEQKLLEVFELIPYIYYYRSTYGKYNGYLVRIVFSLSKPDNTYELLDSLKKIGIISDYFVFEIMDYKSKDKDLKFYNPDRGWIWDWDKWYTNIENCMNNKTDFKFEIEEEVRVVDFDYKDLILLTHMYEDASITLKQLNEILSLSESQIGNRIQKLEEKEIIKGYFTEYSLIKSEKFVYFYCFFEIAENVNNILSCFYQLPFGFMILIESSHKFCVILKLEANDFQMFLKGFDLIRSHLNSYFFQFTYTPATRITEPLYVLFNKLTHSWETPLKEYLSIIEKGAGK